MAGRRPKPTALKIIKGTARKSRLNKNEPKPEVISSNTRCPEWMNPEGKKEWKRMAGKLREVGLLTNCDITAFTMLCQMWGEYVTGTKTGEPVSMAHVTQMRLLAGEFGLTPASRSKVAVSTTESNKSNEVDPWDLL